MRPLTREERFRGLILGTAVGDALGLPFEGLTRGQLARLRQGRWRHRFLLGRGFVSDDTDHTLLVALSLTAAPRGRDDFERDLAWRLRGWLAGLPVGAGRATYLAVLRLWLGFGPGRSGIHSAGNGPAMRSAVIGAFFADDADRLGDFVAAGTLMTHTDPRALVGARAIALVAALNTDDRPDVDTLNAALRSAGPDDVEWAGLCEAIESAAEAGLSVAEFAASLGLGEAVTGFINHTVPVAIHAWHTHWGDFEATVREVLDCGGDTDTVAAIAGAIAGATVGEAGIPRDWIDGLAAWPHGPGYMRRVAAALESASASGRTTPRPGCFWPALPVRNLIGNLVSMAHLPKHFVGARSGDIQGPVP